MGGSGSEDFSAQLERYSGTSWEIELLLFAEAERTERATPRKRRRVREEGRAPVSRELNMAVTFLVFALALKIFGYQGVERITEDVQAFLSFEETEDLLVNAVNTFKDVLLIIGAFVVFSMVAGVMIGALQTRFLFAPKALKPDLNRINPIEGFKRLFSLRSLVELLKSVLKVAIVGIVVYQVLKNRWDEMILLTEMNVNDAFANFWDIASEITLKSGMVLLALAVFDYFYQRWEFEKSIRMTKQEVKDELKEVEGNPEIKRRQRQMMYDILRRRMMEEVPKADVVITNPTHFAVALKYDPDTMNAPVVVAKGVDHLALKIIEIAKENDVPVLRNPSLARALYYKTEIGEEIPVEFYRIVAEVLVYVYTKKGVRI
ncbi:flagellar biosynthetic protein FlhB [Thermotoga petrophila RKU-10]|jgi:flagellar biosynthetic protein FlhB|uniref:Flagellar biosynthetic protein FlhB n=3 Tax=Thermotoga petrophila TaxID=93929 RepID=A5IIM4_THEP1|nr:flagellar biosynthesis protein FlhB [Thermotoga petrophila]ABQ46047.1 flagellar biosynthetic protein FlhB [Thermotoga petrophila RKU-1]ADA66126.1 flagellar biosynthetic protein FlhB [Thermotoga petrophila RKU-10]HAA82158.1 flagellar biosynthesis protein FlhB [Thermotoga petrophila]HBU00070.1 flagellar biosynthesis protein FlhB [Thermotoga petrophila]